MVRAIFIKIFFCSSLNRLPADEQFSDMSEQELNTWLKTKAFEESLDKYKITLTNDKDFVKNRDKLQKTGTKIMTLSLEIMPQYQGLLQFFMSSAVYWEYHQTVK